jgi:rhodanese-related sulfurtransferase
MAIAAALLVLLAAAVTAIFFLARGDDGLAKVHAGLERQFPRVEHITGADLEALSPGDIVLFDTRESAEYATSHIDGAVRVDPAIAPQRFLAEYGELARGRIAIFYCSVGARSTALADKVRMRLVAEGAKQVFNLEKGLFGWHNQRRALVDANGRPTDAIHPYNAFWGRLIDRQDKVVAEEEAPAIEPLPEV